MPHRDLPVRPELALVEREADALLAALRASDESALALVDEFGMTDAFATGTASGGSAGRRATADNARLLLARAYRADSWQRLVNAVQLANAIWDDDADAVRDLVQRDGRLLHEEVLIRPNSNWGPPMSYAANLGRDRIITMLHGMGATDHRKAMGRAALQGRIGTVRMIHEWLGRPVPPDGSLGGPAYTLNVEGTALLLELGGRTHDDDGRMIAPVDVVLQTDSRNPAAKHAILDLYERHGVVFPDSAPMALHRGRVDLLERHLEADPGLLARTFTHREIYPAEMGCGAEIDATVGTPLGGTTLLHMCVDFDEFELARWLLDSGMDPNAQAAVGKSGFGGYTALFSSVVSQPNFWMNYRNRGPFEAPMTRLLLERGADPNIRASIWKRLHPGHGDPARHEYRDVTALSYGRRFHAPIFVSRPALALVEAAGGVE